MFSPGDRIILNIPRSGRLTGATGTLVEIQHCTPRGESFWKVKLDDIQPDGLRNIEMVSDRHFTLSEEDRIDE